MNSGAPMIATAPGPLGAELWTERMTVRFGTTLAANVIRAAFSFFSGVLIARQLGADAYGDLYFLIATFTAIGQLMDAGTGTAFYTFIAQRRRSGVFFAVYFAWIVLEFLIPVIAISVLLPAAVIDRLWLGHDRWAVLLAFGASFLTNQIWTVVSHLGEAVRKTVITQLIVTIQALLHLVLVAVGAYGGWLSVHAVLVLLIIEYTVICSIVGPWLVRQNVGADLSESREPAQIAREFARYCRPLVVSAALGFPYMFADRWLLQSFGGSAQQGFFAIGQQFAVVTSVATISMVKVFWKEVAEAHATSDIKRTQSLYRRVSRALYFTGAWVSCLAIPYSREILVWTVGLAFEPAFLALTLMFLYAVHQPLGQIQGTFCYATGNPRLVARISILMMIVSVPATYLVLAPPSALSIGLGLGAIGLASKMVLLQLGAVTLQEFLIARKHHWSCDYLYQAAVLGVLLGLAWSSKLVASLLFGGIRPGGHAVGVAIVGASLYLVASFFFASRAPVLVGIAKELRLGGLRTSVFMAKAKDGVEARTRS